MHRSFLTFLTVFYTARATGSSCTNASVNEPFDCFNNSTCTNSMYNVTELAQFLTLENKTLDIHKEYERDGYYCRCLKGWTGLRCDTKYESCGFGGHKC